MRLDTKPSYSPKEKAATTNLAGPTFAKNRKGGRQLGYFSVTSSPPTFRKERRQGFVTFLLFVILELQSKWVANPSTGCVQLPPRYRRSSRTDDNAA